MNKSLADKHILITGGSRGIGKAIVDYLLKNGARVGIHFNKEVASLRNVRDSNPGKVFLFQQDFSNTDAIPDFFRNVVENMGYIDVLINNAGIAISSSLSKPDGEWIRDWNRTMDVNLNVSAILCKKAIQHFTARESAGSIINISSRAAFRGDTEDYLAYAASKAGMVALTRSIARAYGKKRIVAFTVAPGFVETDMAQQFFDQYGKKMVLEQIALNELTRPEDIAPFIGFLASGMADHATGGTFDINAGSYVH